ncbi:hypothetical protein [Luteolibacter luteus]|uniref:Uncharacterized protein n=1 Tax=Luteolibacter luteus TaxID=2728835 RepID=A0A858RQ22_9BACT|nr:hypothetical protein [Luteolibacter luteus]QJE99127.1 hypothetical protein HHL09_26220 [Luteolibacter luteus]
MKWRWHRSLIFWSGLLVMGFINWAWWDSCRMITGIGGHGWTMASADAGLLVSKVDPLEAPGFGANREKSESLTKAWDLSLPFIVEGGGAEPMKQPAWVEEPRGPGQSLESRWEEIMAIAPAGMMTAYVPYWLVMISVALLWLSGLAWRWKSALRDTR